MTAVLIFMVAFFVAMGGVTALADARLRRQRVRPGSGQLGRASLVHPSVRDGLLLVAETEEWLRQQYQR